MRHRGVRPLLPCHDAIALCSTNAAQFNAETVIKFTQLFGRPVSSPDLEREWPLHTHAPSKSRACEALGCTGDELDRLGQTGLLPEDGR
jgi:hypothetical protein